jgi:phage antirepressor YoqD-like protein
MYIIKKDKKKFFFDNYKKGDLINVTKTAESLGVTRKTIYSWMRIVNSQK